MNKDVMIDAISAIDQKYIIEYVQYETKLGIIKSRKKKRTRALLVSAACLALVFCLLLVSLPLSFVVLGSEPVQNLGSKIIENVIFPLDQQPEDPEDPDHPEEPAQTLLQINWVEWKFTEEFFNALGAGTDDSTIDKLQNIQSDGFVGESMQDLGDFLERLYEYYMKHKDEIVLSPDEKDSQNQPDRGQQNATEIEYEGCTYRRGVDQDYWVLKKVNKIEDGVLRIPAEIESYPVTQVFSEAAKDCGTLKELIMPSTIEIIETYAFYNCGNLKNIVWSEALTEIESYAFSGCLELEHVELPDHLTKLGSYAFANCYLPNESGLQYVKLPQGLTSIEKYCFSGCGALREVIIPDSVTSIEREAFMSCEALAEIQLPSNLKTIKSLAFMGSGLVSVVVPETVTELQNGTFKSCTSLESVTLPESLTRIGANVFNGCKSLTNINIPKTVTEIGEYAFSECASLSSVTIPDGVSVISQYAFEKCTSLHEITLPQNLVEIGRHAFDGCVSLGEIDLPPKLEVVQDYAFDNTALKHIVLPTSVTDLQDSAFFTVETVEINCSIMQWYGRVTNNYSSGFVFSYDAKVWCNEGDFFANYNREADINYVHLIEGESFQLHNYYIIDAGIAYIMPYFDMLPVVSLNHAFKGSYFVRQVYLHDTIEKFEDGEFSGCNNLEIIFLPRNIQEVPKECFMNCSSLESILIPKSVKRIETDAFAGCDNLKTMEYPGTCSEWHQIMIEPMAIPQGVIVVCTDGEIVIE